MKRLILISITCFALIGCASPYRLTNAANTYKAQPAEDVPVTITRGNISVTAGSLADSFATYPGIGFLINNASNKPLRLSADAVKVTINGEPVAFKSFKQIKRNSRLEKFAGAVTAGSAAMNRSTSGGYNMTESQYQLYRSDYGVSTMQSLDSGMARVSRDAERKFKRRGEKSWSSSRHMRWVITRNFGLARNYYLQDEVIAPGKGVLRVVLVEEKIVDKVAKKNSSGLSPVNVRLTVGKTNYDFKMTLMALKNGQSVFYQPGRQKN